MATNCVDGFAQQLEHVAGSLQRQVDNRLRRPSAIGETAGTLRRRTLGHPFGIVEKAECPASYHGCSAFDPVGFHVWAAWFFRFLWHGLHESPAISNMMHFGRSSRRGWHPVGKTGGQNGGQKLPNTGQNRTTRIT